MEYKIAVAKGDGIGPEIVDEAIKVLEVMGKKYNHKFSIEEVLVGGASIDKYKTPITDEALDICKRSDAVLLGAVGGYKWDKIDPEIRPEKGLLKLRSSMGLFTNIRPAKIYKPLASSSPIKREIVDKGIDILICRELTGDVYFGKHRRSEGEKNIGLSGFDEMSYSEFEINRIGKVAFDLARKRRKKLTSIDKANVLETSRVWRETMQKLAKNYPDVSYNEMYVDNCAMQLIRDPGQFDVLVTGNLFGDILSDEASMITGSIGMLPSASLDENKKGMYEPIHGSAPDIAGRKIANPIATILSVAMMLRYSFNLAKEAEKIEEAVDKVLEQGYRTKDIAGDKPFISTEEMGDRIVENL